MSRTLKPYEMADARLDAVLESPQTEANPAPIDKERRSIRPFEAILIAATLSSIFFAIQTQNITATVLFWLGTTGAVMLLAVPMAIASHLSHRIPDHAERH